MLVVVEVVDGDVGGAKNVVEVVVDVVGCLVRRTAAATIIMITTTTAAIV